MKTKILILILFSLVLSACGGKVNLQDEKQAKAIADKQYRFSALVISVQDDALTKKTNPAYFKKQKFSKSMTKLFKREGLLDVNSKTKLKVVVTKVHIRSQIKAFFSVPGVTKSDKLNADVFVVDQDDKVVEKLSVNSSNALGGTAGTLASVRTSLLFNTFSKLTSDLFTGKAEAEEEF